MDRSKSFAANSTLKAFGWWGRAKHQHGVWRRTYLLKVEARESREKRQFKRGLQVRISWAIFQGDLETLEIKTYFLVCGIKGGEVSGYYSESVLSVFGVCT